MNVFSIYSIYMLQIRLAKFCMEKPNVKTQKWKYKNYWRLTIKNN